MSAMPDIDEALRTAALVVPEARVAAAVAAMAEDINRDLAGRDPVLLGVMLGGLVPLTWLSQKLRFAHTLDYVHATRYRGATVGGELAWRVRPSTALAGREVLIVDDILDEGHTLAAIVAALRELGAGGVRVAVLVRKEHARARAAVEVDYLGLTVPDRYVFGCGMDYRGYYRNLPAIYALKES